MSTLCKMSNDQFNAFSSVKGLIIAFMCSSFIIDPKYVALLFLDYWKQKQKKKKKLCPYIATRICSGFDGALKEKIMKINY